MLTVDQPLVFVDTETTHLDPARAIPWEIALIRRPAGAVDASRDETVHLMVAGILPDGLDDAEPEALAVGRFEERYGPSSMATWVTEDQAAAIVHAVTAPVRGARAALVGSCPSYDAAVLAALLRRHGLEPRWDHHTHDLVTWTLATLAGSIVDHAIMPTRAYELSEAVGADRPSGGEAHTALGDARWVRRWWDQLMTGTLR